LGTDRPVTVLAVDDQEVFRRVARGLIAATPGFEQVGEAASGEEALELVAELHPDLVLIDVRMPGMDGIETARRLAKVDDRAVVVLTSIEALPDLTPAVTSGKAEAYIRKQDLTTSTLREVWKAHRPDAG
jgi:DNA-binding NarL/FixJ family response regulator